MPGSFAREHGWFESGGGRSGGVVPVSGEALGDRWRDDGTAGGDARGEDDPGPVELLDTPRSGADAAGFCAVFEPPRQDDEQRERDVERARAGPAAPSADDPAGDQREHRRDHAQENDGAGTDAFAAQPTISVVKKRIAKSNAQATSGRLA